MKQIFTALLLIVSASAFAGQHVNGYTKKDGTYVQPYERTSPNSTRYDNYSTQGNTNPYTGQQGYVSPYPQPPKIQPIQPILPYQYPR